MQQLIDPFNRNITYLRVSVTDHCNYRCHYCRDEDHITETSRNEILSYEEIAKIVRLFSEMGVSKVRLTGGEPLLRKDILNLANLLNNIANINDIPLSTNAALLAPIAGKLQAAGINRLNISLDSLDKKRFEEITRGGDLSKVIEGIDAAIAAGMHPIKLNMVVMRGVNDDEIEAMIDFAIARNIDIRFIETMPIGVAGINALNQHYSEADILKRIHKHLPKQLTAVQATATQGPAKSYLINNTHTSVGIISAVSNNFCASCNRVRLTAKGRLILCLGQQNSVSLRDALRSGMSDDEIKTLIVNAINNKPERHEFDTKIDNINMAQMVEIGG
ncbi:Molybdenum cofactor biosynthesis protein MoaA [uncultured Candidatus Thioglobus sp.]|nr:Molybdenum cofactor biosynthesis protein MoaA [uncultured Candidatus Thioglobus sp.]